MPTRTPNPRPVWEDSITDVGTASIGEVFTGPGEVGTDQIKYFLGPDGLDGAFDFPLA